MKNDSHHEDSMQWHPLALAFPLMEGDEWNAFRGSIKATGGNADDPVIYRMVNGRKQGLDGRLREKACAETGCKCHYREVFLDDDKVAEFIIRKNLRRRHLDKETRQGLVATLRGQGMTQAAVATALGVSQSTVERDCRQFPSNDGNSNPPLKVTGCDGKKYPAKKKRAPREPGDERGSGGPHQGKPKQGKPKVDWRKLNNSIGYLIRTVDDIALRAYPEEKKSAEYEEAKRCLEDLLKCLTKWKKLIVK